MIIRESTPLDLLDIMANPLDEEVKGYNLALTGHCKTVEHHNRPVGIGGVVIVGNGVGEIWLILAKEVNQCRVIMYRCIRNILNQYIKELGLKRVQARVRNNYPKAQQMMLHLGFKNEGIIKDTNTYMFSRTIE